MKLFGFDITRSKPTGEAAGQAVVAPPHPKVPRRPLENTRPHHLHRPNQRPLESAGRPKIPLSHHHLLTPFGGVIGTNARPIRPPIPDAYLARREQGIAPKAIR